MHTLMNKELVVCWWSNGTMLIFEILCYCRRFVCIRNQGAPFYLNFGVKLRIGSTLMTLKSSLHECIIPHVPLVCNPKFKILSSPMFPSP